MSLTIPCTARFNTVDFLKYTTKHIEEMIFKFQNVTQAKFVFQEFVLTHQISAV